MVAIVKLDSVIARDPLNLNFSYFYNSTLLVSFKSKILIPNSTNEISLKSYFS
jgi:hypothetical protein